MEKATVVGTGFPIWVGIGPTEFSIYIYIHCIMYIYTYDILYIGVIIRRIL